MTNEPETAIEVAPLPVATPGGELGLSGRPRFWAVLKNKLSTGSNSLYWALAYIVALAIAASGSMCLVVGQFTAAQDSQNDVLKNEISELEKQIGQVKALREQIQALLAKKKLIESLQRDRKATVLDFQTISGSVPHDQIEVSPGKSAWSHLRQIYLTEMEVVGNKLVLRGESFSAGRVSSLMRRLQDGHFDDAKLKRLEPVTAAADNLPPGLISFVIEMERSRDGDQTVLASSDVDKSISPPVPPTPEDSFSDSDAIDSALMLIAFAVGGGIILLAARHVRQRWLRRRQSQDVSVREGAWAECLRVLQSVDHANPDTWPLAVRLFVIAEVFVLVLSVSFYTVVSDDIDALQAKMVEEIKLKEEFLTKKRHAANLDSYVEQLKEVDKELVRMLKQLPYRFDGAGLLVDINQAALGRGLALLRFRPATEVVLSELHAMQTWSIQVEGSFDDIGAFVADIGRFSQIVTLPDYRLSVSNAAKSTQMLILHATLRTYRYLDEEEVAKLKLAATKARGKK